MKFHKIAFWLLVIGGINWLLTALVDGWDLADYIGSGIAMIVYILVGIAALVEAFGHKKMCNQCN